MSMGDTPQSDSGASGAGGGDSWGEFCQDKISHR